MNKVSVKNGTLVTRVCVFTFILSILALFASGHYGGDGLENYLTAESMVLDHNLTIHDRPFEVKEMKYEARGIVDPEGGFHSTYGIGMPILLIPLYVLGNLISKFIPNIPHDYLTQFAVSMTNPIIVALTALVLFVFLENLAYSKRTAFFTAVCYSFCTMSFIYARSGFSEPAVGLFVMAGLFLIYKYEKTRFNKYLLYAACCMGYTLLIKKNSFLYLPVIASYLIYKSFKTRSPAEFIKLWLTISIPILFFILAYFYVQNIGMKNISATNQKAFERLIADGTVLGLQILKGLYYYFLSPGKGFFLYNIPLILALFAIKDFTKKRKELAAYIVIFIAVNILYYSLKFIRGTIFSWGPRYLYLLVPLMCMFLAEYIENAKTLGKKITVMVFCVTGFMIQLPCLFINMTNYLLFVKEKLGLQEYLINFIPELSPIKGAWWIFISAIKRLFGAGSLNFIYNPDRLFIEPIIKPLTGYDTWDVWWINVLKITPNYKPIVIFGGIVLIVIAAVSFAKLKKQVFGKIRSH